MEGVEMKFFDDHVNSMKQIAKTLEEMKRCVCAFDRALGSIEMQIENINSSLVTLNATVQQLIPVTPPPPVAVSATLMLEAN